MTIKAPYLTYRDVGRYVENFLNKFHQSLELPIPIEWIIESDLKLNIIPVNNLYRAFNQSGFLSHDRMKIFIDEYQYDNFIEKYRFTLAHEVGHFVMHESLYEGISFSTEQEYLDFFQSIPRKELYWLEKQCDWFAGQLLVPSSRLEKHCIDLLESKRSLFSESKYLSYEFWPYASNKLAPFFEVSPLVIEICIENENFNEKFKNYYQKK